MTKQINQNISYKFGISMPDKNEIMKEMVNRLYFKNVNHVKDGKQQK